MENMKDRGIGNDKGVAGKWKRKRMLGLWGPLLQGIKLCEYCSGIGGPTGRYANEGRMNGISRKATAASILNLFLAAGCVDNMELQGEKGIPAGFVQNE